RTERLLDERLAERLAEIAVGVLHAALPPRTQLLRTGQRLAVEGEVLVDEGRRQHRRRRVEQLPPQIRLDVVDGRRGEDLAERLEEVGLGDVQRVDRRRADPLEVCLPLELRRQRLQLLRRELVVDLVRVAARRDVE